jgi:high-affinity nickel-transport protein
MVNVISIVALGFFLGMRHATDPDHVIAVSTIVSRERNIAKSAWVGAVWGVGHTLTIFIVGAALILLDFVGLQQGSGTAGFHISPRIGLLMDLAVAVMLIALGILNIRRFTRWAPSLATDAAVHSHSHAHGDYVHAHPHGHAPESHPHATDQTPVARLDKMLQRFRSYNLVRPLIIGIVHGLSGSAAVALLVVPIIRDPRWSVAYLLVFGVGTIIGMMLITLTIASTFHMVRGGQKFFQRLAFASGLLSLCFGLVIAYQICIVNGLFTAHPMWTPK